jgi:hypothetical protein
MDPDAEFGEEAEAGPASELRAERLAWSEVIFRKANEGIREAAEVYRFESRIPFICECEDPHCRQLIRLTHAEYLDVRDHPRRFFSVPGHEGGVATRVVLEKNGYVVVEKHGYKGERLEEEYSRPADES